MSFIRCLSNPEGLYIYTSSGDETWIHHCMKPPLASKSEHDGIPNTFVVPEKDFMRVGQKWAKGGWYYHEYTPVRSGRLVAQEVHVFLATGDRVPRLRQKDLLKRQPRNAYLIKLSHGRHFVMMWRTTWHYIVDSILRHIGWDRKHAKRRRKAGAAHARRV